MTKKYDFNELAISCVYTEPTNIKDLTHILYTLEEEFLQKESLLPVLYYVKQEISKYEFKEVLMSGILEKSIQLCYRLDEFQLLLEFSNILQVEKFLDYLTENNVENEEVRKEYEYLADIIAIYFVALEKLSLFNEEIQHKFINTYLNYFKKDLLSIQFIEVLDTPKISLELLKVYFKCCLNAPKNTLDKLILRMFKFLVYETDLIRFLDVDAYCKKYNMKFDSYFTSLKVENKFLFHIVQFLYAHFLDMTNKEIVSKLVNVINSVNNKTVSQTKEFTTVMRGIFDYLDTRDTEDYEDIIVKLMSAATSSKFKMQFILPNINYDFFLISLKQLFKVKEYNLFYKIYTNLPVETKDFIHSNIPFETAYVVNENNEKDLSKVLYEKCISEKIALNAALNNLAIIYEKEEKYDKAKNLLLKGKELFPDDSYINKNLERIQKVIKKIEEKPKFMKNYYFKKTDRLQKRILFTIYKLLDEPEVTFSIISESIGMKDDSFFRHKINPLLNNGLISYKDNQFEFDPTIYELIKEYVDPTIERQIIKSNKNKFYRPIFYHESEINLYKVLLESFPQHLVFPNMDLKAVIDVDKIKKFLTKDEFEYLFKAHVDFAIINTTTYFPIITFEKDSEFNDSPRAEHNKKIKNHIFEISGIPLIRVRYNSAMDHERLKEEIKKVTKDFLLDIQKESPNNDILKEFDLKKFGIYKDSIDEEEIKAFWNDIVGELVANNTLSFYLDQEQMLLSITLAKETEPIIKMVNDRIKTSIYEKYPQLNQITFYYD